nr:hypothetical protein [Streptomyces sp. CBMA29]
MPTSGDRLSPPRPDRAESTVESTVENVVPGPRAEGREPAARAGEGEPQGCLYALSQPPLMLFLCVIGGLLGAGAIYDLLLL